MIPSGWTILHPLALVRRIAAVTRLFPPERRFPLRYLIVGDFGDQDRRRRDGRTYREAVQILCHRNVRPRNNRGNVAESTVSGLAASQSVRRAIPFVMANLPFAMVNQISLPLGNRRFFRRLNSLPTVTFQTNS